MFGPFGSGGPSGSGGPPPGPAVAEIPGYHYDGATRRYYRLARGGGNHHHSFTQELVSRRKREADAELEREEKRRRHEELVRASTMKRSKVLQMPIMGGFLARELGDVNRESLNDAWALGLRRKGQFYLLDPEEEGTSNHIGRLWVGTQDTTSGLGMAYASLGHQVMGVYLHCNEDEELRYGTAASVFRTTKFLPLSEGVVLKGISDIKYNPNYHKVIVTSASMGEGLAIFSPKMWDAEDQYPHPQWDLGGSDPETYIRLEDHVRYGPRTISSCTTAPPGADYVAVLASSHGVMVLTHDEKLRYLDRRDGSNKYIPNKHLNDGSYLSVDFKMNSCDVLLAGTMGNMVKIFDMRKPRGAPWIRRKGRTNYVKSISEHHVLAAGMGQGNEAHGDMSVYDLRFLRQNDPAGVNDPLVRFPAHEYMQGAACAVQLDRGIVAVHEHTRMKLYSLRSGRRITCPAIDKFAPGCTISGAVWATMPNEQNPSLFVAARNAISKFSFGNNFDEDVFATSEPTRSRKG